MNPKRRRQQAPLTFELHIPTESLPSLALARIAVSLERLADRLDADAKVFNEMVKKGKNLSA
jgi:hypothetical protein